MASGDCDTFIQAVAIQLLNVQPKHSVVFRRSSLLIDGEERKAELNVTLGPQMVITASGTGRATELPERVDHQTLADCHVLPTVGQLVPKAQQAQQAQAQSQAQQAQAQTQTQLAAKRPERPIGGVWQACTRNEWTLTTPDMVVDVGVIGPFEAGYLREGLSDRTFNLDVKALKDMDVGALQGIINGDRNGLFVVDPSLNPAPDPDHSDAASAGHVADALVPELVPEGPHGNVQEVVAANVPVEELIFAPETMARMDAACGAQQALRAIRMTDAQAASDEQRRGWKNWKSHAPKRP